MSTPSDYISYLQLLPHPEGGYYKETYRSLQSYADDGSGEFPAGRSYSTAIYYLLEQGDFSAFHKIQSDECWHHYAGDTLLIHIIYENGNYDCIRLGKHATMGEVFQYVVPANAWFASEPSPGSMFVLAGCTVAPGFDFRDFLMARQIDLLASFPQHAAIIKKLCAK